MNYLVGLTALGGRDALSLGRMLARTAGVTLTVCVVGPETWGHPSPARVDAEYAKFLDRYAEEAIAEVRAFSAPSGCAPLPQVQRCSIIIAHIESTMER